MAKATPVKYVEGFSGIALLFKVDPAVEYDKYDFDTKEESLYTTEYIVVSATVTYSGPETYIFPADENGMVVDWSELGGSFNGSMDIRYALKRGGYELEEVEGICINP